MIFIASMFFSFSCATQRSTASIPPLELSDLIQARLSAQEVKDGSLVLVSVNLPAELRKKEVLGEFEGAKLPFYPAPRGSEGEYEAVLGVPHNHAQGVATVKICVEDAGGKCTNLPLKVVDGNYTSETLKVGAHFTNPSKKQLERIRRDVAEVALIYSKVTRKKYWDGPFVFPIQSPMTSPFGTKRVFNGEFKSFHGGLDLKAPTGTEIHAPAAGEVVLAKFLYFTGNTVMIDHGYGVITLYAHMSKLKVKKGQIVQPGNLLGLSGMTGRANGPHLHWQAVVHRTKVNPLGLIQVMR